MFHFLLMSHESNKHWHQQLIRTFLSTCVFLVFPPSLVLTRVHVHIHTQILDCSDWLADGLLARRSRSVHLCRWRQRIQTYLGPWPLSELQRKGPLWRSLLCSCTWEMYFTRQSGELQRICPRTFVDPWIPSPTRKCYHFHWMSVEWTLQTQ